MRFFSMVPPSASEVLAIAMLAMQCAVAEAASLTRNEKIGAGIGAVTALMCCLYCVVRARACYERFQNENPQPPNIEFMVLAV